MKKTLTLLLILVSVGLVAQGKKAKKEVAPVKIGRAHV